MRQRKRREPIQVAAQMDPEKAKKPAEEALAAAPQRKPPVGEPKKDDKETARKKQDEEARRALEASLDNDARARVRVHTIQFSPERHQRGEVAVGAATVKFYYDAQGKETGHVLVLEVPEGVRAVAVPMDVSSSALQVEERSGAGGRHVRIGVRGETAATPRVQVTFTSGVQTCIARFEL